MKRVLVIISLIVCSFLNIKFVVAEDIPKPELVKLANKELTEAGIMSDDYFSSVENYGGKPLSTSKYLEGMRNLIVYGEPFELDPKTERNRYLGYTMEDTFFTNYLFRNDATSPIGLYNRIWIENPKNNPDTRLRPELENSQGKFNNNPYYEKSIRLGLKRISRIDFRR